MSLLPVVKIEERTAKMMAVMTRMVMRTVVTVKRGR
jgi:hypothetical protein